MPDACLEENLWAPGLACCGISPDKAETGPGSKKMVQVGIADVVVRLDLETGLHLGELMFQHREVDVDVVLFPELSLVTERAVRTAPNQVSQGLSAAHHVHGNDTGGITHFQRPINVKANELRQACTSRLQGAAKISLYCAPSAASAIKSSTIFDSRMTANIAPNWS